MVDRQTGRLLWRAAVRIHKLLFAQRNHLPDDLALSTECWHLGAVVLQMQHVHNRGWRKAVLELGNLYDRLSRSLIDSLQHRRQWVRESLQQPALVPVQEIWRDLLALHQEFPEVKCDLKAGTLTVVTDEIVLEEIDLGSFRIVLDWKHLEERPAYRVLSECVSGTSVMHPHVQDRQLCEGDGSAPIAKSLEQGRLLDFFILVRQILETYNPDSAYRNLSSRCSRDCQDCGSSVSIEEISHCDACGNELCSDCRYGCQHCANDCCSQCHGVCSRCMGIFCPSCLEPCATCSREFCGSCLETPECCLSCDDKESTADAPNETTEEIPPQQIPPADSSVHPVCVGEAPVPA